MNYVTNMIDSLTMYRVVLYGLSGLLVVAFLFAITGVIYFSPLSLLAILATLLVSTFAVHTICAKLFRAPADRESSLITALILFFIVFPGTSGTAIVSAILAAVIAISSKYILRWNKKHLLNPAAAALVALGILSALGTPIVPPIWWIGSAVFIPFVLLVSIAVVAKIRRFPLFFTYLGTSVLTVLLVALVNGDALVETLRLHFISWPVIFFAGIMLTEPATMPGTKRLRIVYAILVGVLSSVSYSVGIFHGTPELALIIGNILLYPWMFKSRLVLTLKNKERVADNTYNLSFLSNKPCSFSAGQYLEWTLPHKDPDTRGIRRYFTIASAPEDHLIHLGLRWNPEATSSYKKALMELNPGDRIYAGNLAGDFTLPRDTTKKLAFIAGGVGITPFKSMVEHMLHEKSPYDTVLVYASKTADELAYRDIFERALATLPMKLIYVTSDGSETDAQGVAHETGFVSQDIIVRNIPDWQERIFYISGPDVMVNACSKTLRTLGVPRSHIKKDYFSGYA